SHQDHQAATSMMGLFVFLSLRRVFEVVPFASVNPMMQCTDHGTTKSRSPRSDCDRWGCLRALGGLVVQFGLLAVLAAIAGCKEERAGATAMPQRPPPPESVTAALARD